MLGLKQGTVKLAPYNSKWPEAFEQEKRVLQKALNGLVLDIQHIGSRSIPGLKAKPIIDISVGIRSMKDSKKLIPLLESIGYECRADFPGGPNIQLFFAKGPGEKRTHYLHLMKFEGRIWNHDLLFRGYLRENKKRAMEYLELKSKLADKYSQDRTTYTANKAKFIKETLRLAKEEKDLR
jgi:GrpB-like predicted nucleotidyltransferase (UPF0157 family)